MKQNTDRIISNYGYSKLFFYGTFISDKHRKTLFIDFYLTLNCSYRIQSFALGISGGFCGKSICKTNTLHIPCAGIAGALLMVQLYFDPWTALMSNRCSGAYLRGFMKTPDCTSWLLLACQYRYYTRLLVLFTSIPIAVYAHIGGFMAELLTSANWSRTQKRRGRLSALITSYAKLSVKLKSFGNGRMLVCLGGFRKRSTISSWVFNGVSFSFCGHSPRLRE